MFKLTTGAVALAAALFAGWSVAPAAAQDFPDRPISLVIPFGAGGSHDLNARVFTSVISEYLGQPMVVRLMPGGGGQAGTAAVAEAPADGYTLLFTHNFVDQLQPHVTSLPYEPEDFVTVVTLNSVAPVLAVRADSQFQTIEELVEWSRENPGQLRFGHGGNWASLMVPGVMLMHAADFEANLVPHQGGGPAMRALLAGDIDVTPTYLSIVVGQEDQLRIIASFSDERIRDDIPTLKEAGIDVSSEAAMMQRVILAPAGIPEDRLERLRQAFAEMQDNDTYKQLMARIEENTDLIPGDVYDRMRAEQKEVYGELARRILGN